MSKTKRDTFEIHAAHFGIDVQRVAELPPHVQKEMAEGFARALNANSQVKQPFDVEEVTEDFIFYVNNVI